MNEIMLIRCSVVYHTEKKSDGKSGLLPLSPDQPLAPIFLQGLSDLKVMDGSQVTMTVQVSGLSLCLSPWDVCEKGHGYNMGIIPQGPAQNDDLPEN